MPAQWTGDVIGEMHLKKISHQQLAHALGWHPKYLSAVLNGHREPKNAEEKVRSALKNVNENALLSLNRNIEKEMKNPAP